MLVLCRKAGETIHIGADIRIRVVTVQGNRVRIAVEAPEEVLVLRGELAGLAVQRLNASREIAGG
jgi:carbon storage regulator